MRKHGTGIGSTLIVLVFSVLCLSIFALLSLTAAMSDKSMADAAVRTAKGYYDADTLAECILAEILEADITPDTVRGVSITTGKESGTVSFFCIISENKALHVEAAVFEEYYDILKWCVRDIEDWETDKRLNVWVDD